MRYSEKELAQFGCSAQADHEGRLNYRPPSGNFSQSGFKERWFKLKANFLFYFRITELGVIDRKEPAGVFVLENFSVKAELIPGVPFSFCIMFQDDNDKRHVFSTRSEEQVQQWVSVINTCSYGHWRRELRMLQSKIKSSTGKDPLLMYPGYNDSYEATTESITISALSLSPSRPTRSHKKTTSFKSHLTADKSRATNKFLSHVPVSSTGLMSSQFGGSAGNLPSAVALPATNLPSAVALPSSSPAHAVALPSSSPAPAIAIPPPSPAPTVALPQARPAVAMSLPPPPRPSRANQRQRPGEVPLVATRSAPPPPTSTTKNLIEF